MSTRRNVSDGPDAERLRSAITRRWGAGTPVHASVAGAVNNLTGASPTVYCDDIAAILCGKRSLAGAKGGAVLRWVEAQEVTP